MSGCSSAIGSARSRPTTSAAPARSPEKWAASATIRPASVSERITRCSLDAAHSAAGACASIDAGDVIERRSSSA